MGNGPRIQFSDSDRRRICELHKAYPTLSLERLTDLAAKELEKPGLKRSSITGILKESDKLLSCEHSVAGNKVKHRAAKRENLENVLMEWFGQMRAKGAILSDRLVTAKAKSLAEGSSLWTSSIRWLAQQVQKATSNWHALMASQVPQTWRVLTLPRL